VKEILIIYYILKSYHSKIAITKTAV